MELIRGTTPTIKITFSTVSVESIAVAYLTIKQNDRTMIEKTLEDATTEEHAISWRLTQTETLGLLENVRAVICCDWRLADGTRGRSRIESSQIGEPGKDEVI